MAFSESPAAPLTRIPAAWRNERVAHQAEVAVASVERPVPSASAELLLSAIALTIGASIHGPLLLLVGLPFALAGFVLTVRVLWMPSRKSRTGWMPPVEGWLAAMAAVGLMGAAPQAPVWYDILQRLYFASGLAAIGLVAGADRRRAGAAVRRLIVAGVVLNLIGPLAVTNPRIDVWAVTQAAAHDLLRGIQPYTVQPPDFYKGAVDYQYSLTVYPYMPATLIVFAPVVALLHDYRLLLAICLPVTLVLLRATCRTIGSDRRLTDMITIALLLNPRGLSVAAMGWSEPLMVVSAAAAVFFLVRARGQLAAAIAWFLLPAVKQYVVVPPLLFMVMLRPRPRVRTVVAAAAVAAATVVPFALWAWRPTWNGMVFQFSRLRAPRLDSTSLVALIGAFTGIYVSRWSSVVAQLAIGGVGYWRQRREGLAGLLIVSAASLYATFLVGWQAFVNYYYFVAMLLLLAAAVASGPGELRWRKASPGLSGQGC